MKLLTMKEALLLPEAEEQFKVAHEIYAQAVEVADWLGFPHRVILCWHLGWFYSENRTWAKHQGWTFTRQDPGEEWRYYARQAGPRGGYLFKFNNHDDAREHGLQFGTAVRWNGSIEPYEETPEGLAEEEARLERLTRPPEPTPIHLLSRTERRRLVKAEMAKRTK